MNNNTAKDDAAIRGDFVANGPRTLTLTNNFFGLNENVNAEAGKVLYHVNVGDYSGNTDGTRKAGTY